MSPWRGPQPIIRDAVRWACAGAWAGLLVGALDCLWSWPRIDQFAPFITTKARVLVYAAALLSLATGIGAGVLAIIGGSCRRLASRLEARPESRSSIDTANDRTTAVATALSVSLVVQVAIAATYLATYRWLATRHHIELMISTAMLASAAATLVGLASAKILAPVLQRPIHALAGRFASVTNALSHPMAPFWSATGVILFGTVIALAATWSTTQRLPLRPAAAMIACCLLTAAIAGRRRRLPHVDHGRLRILVGFGIAAVIVLITGSVAPVQKSTSAYTALAGHISQGIRTVVDFDGDGYSPILGGGDCNDFASRIHPNSMDLPEDGVDGNCLAGDPSADKLATEPPIFSDLPATTPAKPSVVLITIDTLRADHLGAYGYARATSPNLDALAAEGTVFLNAWAHAPSTRYSIPSILTGRLPLDVFYDNGVKGWPGLLPKGDTVATVMKSQGYQTGAVLNYWYFDRERGMDRGFDVYDNGNRSLHRSLPGKGPAETKGSSSRQQTDRAIRYLEDVGDSPFFLWVHYYDPHLGYEPHSDIEAFGDAAIDRYDGEIAFTDKHIGRLIEDIKRRELYDKTVFVVTGDHGEGFGEHGVDLHGYHLYAAQTKIPLIVRVPGAPSTTVRMPAGHIDILPTIANLVGAPPSRHMQGRSLVPSVLGTEHSESTRWIFQQLSYENGNEIRAAANEHCHIIFNMSPHTSWELYNLKVDPLEANDRIDSPGDCRDARQVLEAWVDRSEIPPGAIDALVDPRSQPRGSINLKVGSLAELIDVNISAPVKRGELISVTYTFRALGNLDDSWRVFAHFDGDGGRRFTDDHSPTRPFSWWRTGDVIRYTREFRVPRTARPGSYALWFGVFRGSKRQPMSDADITIIDDRAKVASVVVQ